MKKLLIFQFIVLLLQAVWFLIIVPNVSLPFPVKIVGHSIVLALLLIVLIFSIVFRKSSAK